MDTDVPGLMALPGQSLPDAPMRSGGDLVLSGYLPAGHGFLLGGVAGDPAALAAARARADAAERRARAAEEQLRLVQDGLARADAAFRAVAQDRDDATGAERALSDIRGEPFRAARPVIALREAGAWQRAQAAETVAAFEAYLAAYPEGVHAESARDRSSMMEGGVAGTDRRAATAGEEALGLNRPLRQSIEDRLARLGLDPGQVDGVFDDATRRALRRYQTDARLPVIGYFTQELVVQLLTDSVLDLLGR